MNTKKVLAALALSATMAFGATGLAACTPEENKGGESGDRDLQIYAIYELYAETAGDDAMTYDQWYANLLETAKGAKGDNGKSAYDIWKENGHTGTEQDFLDSLKGTDGNPGAAGKSAYQLWLDAGNTGTEQDFLNSLKGTNGTTPEITISDDGYWEINGQKTSQKAQGEAGQNGTTPEITISDDGYWEINGQKTSQKAQGENGQPGTRGNKITKGEGAPTSTEGAIEGDIYVDTKEWNVYFFEGSSWKNYGSIKGADGKDGSVSPEQSTIKLSVNANETTDVDIPADTAQGVHIIEADLGATKLSTGRLQMYISGKEEVKSELVFSESRSQAQHNVYFSYINVAEGDTKINFHATDEAVNADITVKDYEMPTLKADGTPVEVPVNLIETETMEHAVYKFKVDSSFSATSYTVNVTKNFKGVEANLKLYFVDEEVIMITKSKFNNGSISISDTKLSGYSEYAFLTLGTISNGSDYNFIYPVTISLQKSS